MRTIQSRFFKKAFPLFLIFFLPFISDARSPLDSMQVADSLFNQRLFTQSYRIYKSIYESKGEASPAMLLKMAYIQEGIKNYTDALYYLNIYYFLTFNKRALRKMEQLAAKNDLKGYQITDIEFFRNILYRYYVYFIITLVAVTCIIFAYIIHTQRKYHTKPAFSFLLVIFALLLLAFVVNFNHFNHRGQLINDHNFLMEGPSPGSKLIDVTGKGSRIKILGQKGTWYKIRWSNRTAYVRRNDVRLIPM